jgi:glycosyltransferase involved in cell wall biosynthesis
MTNKNISVVIATLGGGSLEETIESLNNSSIVPKEIIICIPEEYAIKVKHLNYSNIQILKTKVQGQVSQRAVGFQNAKFPFVLQLDDDIKLDFYCLENLLKIVISKSNIAVGPKLYDNITKEYHSFLTPYSNKLNCYNKLFYFIANGKRGYQPGKISKSGINFGLPEFPGTVYDLDWLCGGCILHRKENLILRNYYPVSGKAYAEDLFHSKLLRSNKIILVRSGEAKCYVDFSSSKGGGILIFFRNFRKSIIPMKIFVRTNNGSLWHLYFIYIFILTNHVLKYVNQSIKRSD